MATINELLIKLEADTTQLRRAFDQSEKQVEQSSRKMQASISKIDLSVAGLAKSFGALLPALSIAAVASFASSALSAAGDLGELSEQIGISTDAIQAYRFAGTQAGVSNEVLEQSFIRLRQAIGEAAQGSKAQLDAFKALGIGVLDANGAVRSSEAIFDDLADAYVNAEDKAKFFANAQDLLGRNAQRLAPLLAGGRQGLRDFEEAARRAGVVLDKELIAAADKAADRIAVLTFKLKAFGQIGVAELTRLADLGFQGFLAQDEKSLERIQLELDRTAKKVEELRARVKNRQDQGFPAGLDAAELAKQERLLAQLEARRDFLRGPPPSAQPSAPSGPATNPQSQEEADAIKAATAALEKKVAALRQEADGQYMSEAAKAQAKATEETLIALRAKGIQGLNDEQRALIAQLGVQTERIQAQKTEIENIKAFAATLNEYVDNATAAANAEAILSGQVLKTAQATDEQVRLLNEQADAAAKSVIRYNAMTQSFEVYDRELQIVAKTQELLAQNTALSTEEARRQAEQFVDASERLKRGTEGVEQRVRNMNEAAQDFSRVIGTAFEDAILSGAKFGDVLKALEQDIARIILRMTVTKPLENALTGALGGFNFGSIFSGFGGGGVSAGDAGLAANLAQFGRETGGPVEAGVPYIVGERRPEIFVPETAGRILPRVPMGGGEQVVVHQSFNFTGDVTAQTRAEVLRMAPILNQQAVAAMENKQRRGRRV
jgi:hypothetical protein